MSTTSESSAGSNPPALSFAEKRDTSDTRWGAGVVAAIIIAIAVVAAGVTAAVVLANKRGPAAPPPPALPPSVVQSNRAAGPLAGLHDVNLMSWSTHLASGQMLMAAGKSVPLGDSGVSFDVPSGWTATPDKNFVGVSNDSGPGSFMVFYGVVKDPSVDAAQFLADNFKELTSGDGFSNVQTSKVDGGQLKPEMQKNFDQLAFNQFSASVTTQQGSGTILGEAFGLVNSGKTSSIKSPAGFATFILMFAKDEATYKAAVPDLTSMLVGIIGASPTSS
jgi:hypothetical protein